MTILEALKSDKHSVRLDCGDRWLGWDDTLDLWTVYERKPRDRNSKVVKSTPSEESAVKELLKG